MSSYLKSGAKSGLFHQYRIQERSAEQKIGIFFLPTLPYNFWYKMIEYCHFDIVLWYRRFGLVMRVLEHYQKPSKSMKKSTLKIANFQDFDIFCYVIRVGKFSHCDI